MMVANLVHHWAQGPLDVRSIVPISILPDRIGFWVFNYYIEYILGIPTEQVDWILNRAPQAWSRTGVAFHRVFHPDDAQIILRFTDDSPVGWPNLPWGPGWYYHDATIGKNVAQMTPHRSYLDNPVLFAYVLGMELAGHGCFRMHDMYLHGHGAYRGAMGDWEAAQATEGFPTDLEIAAGMAWLKGQAIHVHSHEGVTVPEAVHGAPHPHGFMVPDSAHNHGGV